jgi:hypothetical protein
VNPRFILSACSLIFVAGCSSSSATPPAAAAGPGAAADAGDQRSSALAGKAFVAGEDIDAGPSDFDCLKNAEWTTVGLSRFKNALGHTDETLAVARSVDGGEFPVGTIIQLVPTEASVKRGAGFNAASHDWEFFSLGASATGTTIMARGGGASVVNFTGSSCLDCHDKAAAQWDFLCGDPDGGNSHGCAPLPLTNALIESVQSTDPRCNDQ